jgi:thiamine-phosphate pyrophosphorylase
MTGPDFEKIKTGSFLLWSLEEGPVLLTYFWRSRTGGGTAPLFFYNPHTSCKQTCFNFLLVVIIIDMERFAYRIIDANFNRAREACRIIEDICRFALNNAALTAELKQFRHQLCTVISTLDSSKLLTARDTTADVGTTLQVQGQMTRADMNDSLTAACKRLPEALRVIAETLKPSEPDAARLIEQLRYRFYTLEKDIVLDWSTTQKFSKVKLYVIITNDQPCEILSLVSNCIEGGADCIQLRAKGMPDDQLFATAQEMVRICRDSSVLSIMNDRVDIAVAAGADGVHLGQDDLPAEHARRIALTPLIIGKSTHSMDQLKKAIDEKPAYVSLGPVFSTGTKPYAEPVGLEYVSQATAYLEDKGVAHVAIGGITPDNVAEVIRAGAKTVAVCSAVTQVPDVTGSCSNLKHKIEDLLEE